MRYLTYYDDPARRGEPEVDFCWASDNRGKCRISRNPANGGELYVYWPGTGELEVVATGVGLEQAGDLLEPLRHWEGDDVLEVLRGLLEQ